MMLLLLVLASVLSARVVSWTAYSTESQADADEEAIAGVAKQISSHVVSTVAVHQSEMQVADQSEIEKKFDSKKTVHSDLFLKGIKIQRLPKSENRFGSTASIDLDELTSKYRFKLQAIQEEVSKRESSAKKALVDRRYSEVVRNLESIPGQINSYNYVLDEMSTYVPINSSMQLHSEKSSITEAMIEDLRRLVIKADIAKETNNKDAVMFFSVDVSNADTYVDGFPLLVKKNGKVLAEFFTDSRGHADIQIPKSRLMATPHEIMIVPNLPPFYCNAAALNPVVLHYPMEVSKCAVNLSCNNDAVCAVVMDKLTNRFGNVYETENAEPAQIRTQGQSKNKFGKMQSYSVTLSISMNGKSCQKAQVGAGHNKDEALVSAVKKMDVESCFETLEFCSKDSQ